VVVLTFINRGLALLASNSAGRRHSNFRGEKMKFRKLLIMPLFAGVLLTAVGLCQRVAAQDKQSTTTQTDNTKTDTTITGFLTGATCPKTGIYEASNKYLEVIIVLDEGDIFPPFVDGEKITWYPLKPSTKGTFDAVKVSPGSN
jgi:hypothetical protein